MSCSNCDEYDTEYGACLFGEPCEDAKEEAASRMVQVARDEEEEG